MALEEILKTRNYELIDVREPVELEMDGKIEGAKNIPLGEVESRTEEILSIDKPVILFCRSGNRSGKALDFLNSQGLKNGFNGGGWAELNDKLTKIPQGFEKDDTMAEYLKLKHFTVSYPISDEELLAENAAENFTEIFKSIKPLNDFLEIPFGG
jgi:rhodanese-related sulfurtransferase